MFKRSLVPKINPDLISPSLLLEQVTGVSCWDCAFIFLPRGGANSSPSASLLPMLLLLTSCVSPGSEEPHPQLPHIHFRLLPSLVYPTSSLMVWNMPGILCLRLAARLFPLLRCFRGALPPPLWPDAAFLTTVVSPLPHTGSLCPFCPLVFLHHHLMPRLLSPSTKNVSSLKAGILYDFGLGW